jgi:hypothetical protein
MSTIVAMFIFSALMFFFGGLIGSSITEQVMHTRERRQAAFQRQLNAEKEAIKAARRQVGRADALFVANEPFVW